MARRKKSDLKLVQFYDSKIFKPERMQRLTGVAQLRRRWHDIVGSMMASHSEPVSIEPLDGSLMLMIAVDHPIIAQQIRFLYEDIRNACFRQCKIVGLSKVYSRVQAGAGIRETTPSPVVLRPVHFKDARKLAESLQDVEDKAIRRIMFQARIKQFQYQQQQK